MRLLGLAILISIAVSCCVGGLQELGHTMETSSGIRQQQYERLLEDIQ